MRRIFTVEAGENVRLDVYLTAESDSTRSQIKKLVDAGKITVNGAHVKAGSVLRAGDSVEADFPEQITELIPKDIPLDVLYEDDELIVINKQQGLTVHPATGNATDTLVNALLFHCGTLSCMDTERPGIVHRLDKNTSGVMVAAKTDRAHASLVRQFSERTADKRYRAILDGSPKMENGTVTTFIGRDPADRKAMAVVSEGRIAITGYKVLERYRNHCYTEFKLHTGRTHQIRVHARYLGCPVTGDPVYGYKQKLFNLNGQLLHSYKLTFAHPATGQEMTFTAPLPAYFTKVLEILKRKEAVDAT